MDVGPKVNPFKKTDRFAPPLMQAFRAAFRAHDSKKPADQRDASGERVIAGRRNAARRATDEGALREVLSEDLASLLNTVSLGSSEDISEFPFVAKSILNFGLADLTRISIEETAVENIAAELRAALCGYEPRLASSSIEVERDRTIDPATLKVRFNIRADMLASPIDVPVNFVADLELDSAKMRISRLTP